MSDTADGQIVSQSILDFHQGELHRELMLWQVICFDEWIVPVNKENGEVSIRSRAHAGGEGCQIIAFSGPEALNEARQSGALEDLGDDWIVIAFGPLSNTFDASDSLHINPHTSAALELAPQEVGDLVGLANMSGIERALSITRTPPLQENALRAIAGYEGFELILRGPENTLDTAPDSQKRKLLAAFTEPEARDLYLKHSAHLTMAHGVPRVVQLSGAELAQKLTHLDVLGVVFNCAGPRTPLALHRNLGQQVLNAIDAPEDAEAE